MPSSTIHFFSEDIDFILKDKMAIRKWIVSTIKEEGYQPGEINFILCSDRYLHEMNVQYLDHDTLTDIITFDNSEKQGFLAGDVFISVERIRENALTFHVSEKDEIHRVIIHGILHLCGYLDKKPTDKQQMTEKENYYLKTRSFIA